MKKLKRRISPLAKDATNDEIIRWTKSNDVFDRLEAGVSEVIEDHADLDAVLHEAIFQENTAQLNMRLPPAMKAVLSKLARERTTDAHNPCAYLAGGAFGAGIKSRIAPALEPLDDPRRQSRARHLPDHRRCQRKSRAEFDFAQLEFFDNPILSIIGYSTMVF